MKKKCICKNCVHWYQFNYPYNYISGDHCDKKIFKKNEEISRITGQERGKHERLDYRKLNKNNNCPHYKNNRDDFYEWYLEKWNKLWGFFSNPPTKK